MTKQQQNEISAELLKLAELFAEGAAHAEGGQDAAGYAYAIETLLHLHLELGEDEI